jgi:uncharacterized protein YkwD
MGVRSRFAAFAAAQLILLAFCTSAFASADCPGDDVQPTAASASDSAMAVVCDLNQVRAQSGLRALRWDSDLASGAQSQASDMAARHYFSHTTPEGLGVSDRIRPTGYIPANAFWTLSENLGFGTNALSPPSAIVAGWLDSAPHRENVLDPDLQDVGVGIARGPVSDGGASGAIYVADFGARGSADPTPRASSHKRRAHRCTRKVRRHARTCRARRR